MSIRSLKLYVKRQDGQLLVELLIVIGLSAIMLPALLTGMVSSRAGKAQQEERVQATSLLKEAEEAVRSIREQDWANLSPTATDLHTERNGTGWIFVASPETLGNFTRKVVINNVYRDSNNNIISSGTTDQIDQSTKKVTVTVSWLKPIPASIDSTLYLTRYVNNAAFTETDVSDFNAGINSSTKVTNSDGGEDTLTNNNRAKWCSPSLSEATIDLPDGPPVAVSAMANLKDHDTPNDVFVAVAPNNTTSIKLAYLTVSANSDTPSPTLRGTFTLDSSKYSNSSYYPNGINLDNNFKTNDVAYYKAPSGKTYALIATNLSDHEVIAVLVRDENGNEVYQDPDNKIYKYQTFYNTKIYDTVVTTPPTYSNPTSNSAETGRNNGDRNGFQTNPDDAYTNDGSYALDTNSGTSASLNYTDNGKDRHRYYNYNFSIPSGTTINGIEVNLVARADATGGNPKMYVELSWDGGNTWTTAKSTSNLTSAFTSYTLGGVTDNWGRTWSSSHFSNSNFRVRITNVASDTSRDFYLDYVGVKVDYESSSTSANDQAPFGYGVSSITVLGNTGYAVSGGYLYAFDLSNIDSKTPTNGLDMLGCRIELDGYDCNPGSGTDRKYDAGQTGSSWGDTTSPAHNDCSDGGNIEIFADNDIYPIQVGSSKYVFVAVGAGTNPELDIANVTNVPNTSSSPTMSNNSCGRISGGNSGWKRIGSLDFNTGSGTEEAANSVYANAEGTRAYISSNGGIDANHDGKPDSYQLYVLNTENKSSPRFMSGTSTPPTNGYYYGTNANAQLFPRRSLTVLNGQRAILVGKDSVSDSNDSQEYQVLNIESETAPAYCGGVNFDAGFNDLTSVSEADGDNFVYMVANTMEKQLKIIQGGPDDGIYTSTGVFTSKPHQFNFNSAFNYFEANVNQPVAGSTVELQIAVAAANPVTNNCSGVTYTFIGPDPSSPTTSTFKTDELGNVIIKGTIPRGSPISGFQNPGRCVEYKAYLSTMDNSKTPKLLDMTIKYSP